MLPCAAGEIFCHPDVERAVTATCQNVDPETHGLGLLESPLEFTPRRGHGDERIEGRHPPLISAQAGNQKPQSMALVPAFAGTNGYRPPLPRYRPPSPRAVAQHDAGAAGAPY